MKNRALRNEALIFERNPDHNHRQGVLLPTSEVEATDPESVFPEHLLREDGELWPDVGEMDVVTHFHRLSQLNYAVDEGLYPLGSCTMKYNPRINEQTARFPGFAAAHPMQPDEQVQGALRLMWELEDTLKRITGMAGVTLQPAAGAHGELTAASLGIRVLPLRRLVYVAASLLTAAAVTIAGNIGFVGLVVPHMLRLQGVRDNRILLPAAVLLGGSLLLIADTLSRTVLAPRQLPVGILTALIGVPVFLYLLHRGRALHGTGD